jgi:hypothetical protein
MKGAAMPAHQVTISVDGTSHHIVPGLVQGSTLLGLALLAPSDQLLFEVAGDVDIPVSLSDLIVLTGGESFSIGDGCPRVLDNPIVRKAVTLTVNEQPLGHEQHARHAKLTGAEIQTRAGVPLDAELWLDLQGLADERIGGAHRLILREGYTFFTKERDLDEGCNGSEHEIKPVHVRVDDADHTILPGTYSALDLKQRFSIPQDYALERVMDGKFCPVDDSATITIHGGEVFISHVRRGGSS